MKKCVQEDREVGQTYSSRDEASGNLTPSLGHDSAKMRGTSWRIDAQPLFNNGVEIRKAHELFAFHGVNARKGASKLILKPPECLTVMAKVVQGTGEKSGGRHRARHHDHIVVGGDFLGRCRRAFGIDNVVHEVFSVRLESEASGWLTCQYSPLPQLLG